MTNLAISSGASLVEVNQTIKAWSFFTITINDEPLDFFIIYIRFYIFIRASFESCFGFLL